MTDDERDAQRYRWLRERQDYLPDLSECSPALQAQTLDCFIDAEIKRDAEWQAERAAKKLNDGAAP